jgi:hypothetical protein
MSNWRPAEQYTIPDGQAAAPGLPFAAEPSTGFYRKSAGVIGLAVDGAEVGSIGANGLVGGVQLAEVLFTEVGAGTYTGTIPLPAGARIIDIGVDGQAVWTAATSASLIVGDDDEDDGFFTATNLKATDLLAGEINNIEHPGGQAGAYIVSEQRVLYSATARNVIGVVTSEGAGTAGRTRLYVVYGVVAAVAATFEAA